jgi:hypothetical protein
MTEDIRDWKINVAGYGVFDFFGTRQSAEIVAKNKSDWEGGAATIWPVIQRNEIERLEAKIGLAFSAKQGVPISTIRKLKKLKEKSWKGGCDE